MIFAQHPGTLATGWAAFYAVAFVVIVTVELVGVSRAGKGDTITESWRALRDHYPWARPLLMVGMAGFLVWALLHLAFDLV